MSFEHLIEFNGETLTVAEWVIKTGIPFKVIVARLDLGWSPEKTLTTEVRKWNKRKSKDIPKDDDYEDPKHSHRMTLLDVEYGDQGGIL